ncbi:MAG: Ltp family lipoprotein, partial [Intestinibacter bartlettii]|uniref:Ltp family lipoprotein n=1 Tax=Intestinibacter bartlettii TaxID=261299 RepID=UPI0029049383
LMHMSKKGLYKQLTSSYGENFTKKQAQYAVDNVDADWNENALKKAEDYRDTMSMSKSAIYDQLTSSYGEGFTSKQAKYAINNLD